MLVRTLQFISRFAGAALVAVVLPLVDQPVLADDPGPCPPLNERIEGVQILLSVEVIGTMRIGVVNMANPGRLDPRDSGDEGLAYRISSARILRIYRAPEGLETGDLVGFLDTYRCDHCRPSTAHAIPLGATTFMLAETPSLRLSNLREASNPMLRDVFATQVQFLSTLLSQTSFDLVTTGSCKFLPVDSYGRNDEIEKLVMP